MSTSINPSSHNGLQRINWVDTGTDLKNKSIYDYINNNYTNNN